MEFWKNRHETSYSIHGQVIFEDQIKGTIDNKGKTKDDNSGVTWP